jgi:AraC-like DNA-binding protein
MTVLCDTRAVEAGDRFELWSHCLKSSFFPLRVERMQRAAFNARLEVYSLGALQVFRGIAGGCAPVRTAACIAAGDPERLQVHLLRRGQCQVTQEERASMTTAGDITLVGSSRPFTVRSDGPHDLLIFSIPLRLLGPHADRLGRWTAVRIPGDRGLAARVGPFLSGIADGLQDGSIAQDDVAVADGVVALTRALCGPSDSAGGLGETFSGRLLARVKCYIDTHLHEPDLGPESIAAAHFVSTRYLHKLFEAEEMTLHRWIQHRRMERCCADLLDETFAEQSIASIAARWGFRNRDVFTRLLRTSYGVTPVELRARAWEGRVTPTPSARRPSVSARPVARGVPATVERGDSPGTLRA